MANLFAWENWHLLWYLTIFLLLLYRRRRWSNELSAAGTTLGLGAAFLAAVFWGTDLSASIANATTLNRAILPLGPATCFFWRCWYSEMSCALRGRLRVCLSAKRVQMRMGRRLEHSRGRHRGFKIRGRGRYGQAFGILRDAYIARAFGLGEQVDAYLLAQTMALLPLSVIFLSLQPILTTAISRHARAGEISVPRDLAKTIGMGFIALALATLHDLVCAAAIFWGHWRGTRTLR